MKGPVAAFLWRPEPAHHEWVPIGNPASMTLRACDECSEQASAFSCHDDYQLCNALSILYCLSRSRGHCGRRGPLERLG